MNRDSDFWVDMWVLEFIIRCYAGHRGKIMSKIENLRGKKAAEILKETGQENNIPVDLRAILHKLEISAISMDFTEIETILFDQVKKRGRILGAVMTTHDNDTAIFYSNDQELMSNHRYRFTIAHELAHCCLDGDLNHVEFRHDGSSDEASERRANIFAGELLIPLPQLEKVSKELLLPTITNLATVFEVSETVMAARIEYLGRSDLHI